MSEFKYKEEVKLMELLEKNPNIDIKEIEKLLNNANKEELNNYMTIEGSIHEKEINSAVRLAIINGRTDILKLLLNKGINPFLKFFIYYKKQQAKKQAVYLSIFDYFVIMEDIKSIKDNVFNFLVNTEDFEKAFSKKDCTEESIVIKDLDLSNTICNSFLLYLKQEMANGKQIKESIKLSLESIMSVIFNPTIAVIGEKTYEVEQLFNKEEKLEILKSFSIKDEDIKNFYNDMEKLESNDKLSLEEIKRIGTYDVNELFLKTFQNKEKLNSLKKLCVDKYKLYDLESFQHVLTEFVNFNMKEIEEKNEDKISCDTYYKYIKPCAIPDVIVLRITNDENNLLALKEINTNKEEHEKYLKNIIKSELLDKSNGLFTKRFCRQSRCSIL